MKSDEILKTKRQITKKIAGMQNKTAPTPLSRCAYKIRRCI